MTKIAKGVHWESRIGRRPRLRDLHIFSAVVESGSMAKAGALLRVTQPAVSKAIGDLEAAIGVRLLDHSPRGVEPTIYGNALLECGAAAFDELRQGVRKIEHLADPSAGELRIGCQAVLARTMLPPIIEQLSRRYPRVSFEVTLLSSPNFEFPDLRHRAIDLMLAVLPASVADNKLADDVNVESVFEDRMYVVASVRSPWAHRRRIELAELIDEPWHISPEGSMSRSFIEAVFAAKGLPLPQIKVASYSVPLQYALCSAGKFISATSGLTLQRGDPLRRSAGARRSPAQPLDPLTQDQACRTHRRALVSVSARYLGLYAPCRDLPKAWAAHAQGQHRDRIGAPS